MLAIHGIALPQNIPVLGHGILLNLKRLIAHPRIVSSLLRDSTYCPDLESISLLSEYYDNGLISEEDIDPYEFLNDALLAIAFLRCPINLQLKFNTKLRLLDWLSQRTNCTTESSIMKQLTNVERSISAAYDPCFLEQHSTVLPRFFGLFPSLKYLGLVEMACPEDLMEESFLKSVTQAIPDLVDVLVEDKMLLGSGSARDFDVYAIVEEVW